MILPANWKLVWTGEVTGPKGAGWQAQLINEVENKLVWGSGPSPEEAMVDAVAQIAQTRQLLEE